MAWLGFPHCRGVEQPAVLCKMCSSTLRFYGKVKSSLSRQQEARVWLGLNACAE